MDAKLGYWGYSKLLKWHNSQLISALITISAPEMTYTPELSDANGDIAYLYRSFFENSLMLSQLKADILRFESANDRYASTATFS